MPETPQQLSLESLRTWVLQLEQRVAQLERAERQAVVRRRRSFVYLGISGAVYLVFLYWMTNLV